MYLVAINVIYGLNMANGISHKKFSVTKYTTVINNLLRQSFNLIFWIEVLHQTHSSKQLNNKKGQHLFEINLNYGPCSTYKFGVQQGSQ